jgi:hypothetical protein
LPHEVAHRDPNVAGDTFFFERESGLESPGVSETSPATGGWRFLANDRRESLANNQNKAGHLLNRVTTDGNDHFQKWLIFTEGDLK